MKEEDKSWASRLLLSHTKHTHTYTQYLHIYTAQANTSWNVNWRTRTLWSWRPLGVFVVKSSNWRLGSE